MRSTTPNQSVRLLLDSGDVREVGRETVDGQAATHYAGTVRVGDVTDTELPRSTPGRRRHRRDRRHLGQQRGPPGQEGRADRTTNGRVTQTAHYSDYGVKVAVQKPPAADTEDFKSLLSQSSTNPT